MLEDQIAAILYDSVIVRVFLQLKLKGARLSTYKSCTHSQRHQGWKSTLDRRRATQVGYTFVKLTKNLADFGVSAKLDSPGMSAQTFIGTPYWMAPEVILLDPETNNDPQLAYTHKADIWSLGITAIEIAEKNPPLSDIHPMRALQLIPKSDLGFAKPKNWSKTFVDFVAVCLTKDPAKRPSASQLLNHPFLAKAKDLPRQEIMKDLVLKSRIAREKRKQGKDEDEDDEKAEPVAPKAIAETIRQAKESAAQSITHMPLFRNASQESIRTGAISIADAPEYTNSVLSSEAPIEIITIGGLHKAEICAGDVLDGQYLLLGGSKGLFFVDMTVEPFEPKVLIRDTSFTQLQVLEDYSVLMALGGKHSHIRQYKLSSIRKLIRFVLGAKAEELAKQDLDFLPNVTIQDESPDESDFPEPAKQETDDEYKTLHSSHVKDETGLITVWTMDYIKIPNTRDTKEFVIQRTATAIFMATLVKQDIVLFQWASEPYSKFMKLKAFWLPEKPKFMKLLHDGVCVREICLGYQNEANMVVVEDSKVVDIPTHREFRTRGDSWKSRWRGFSQIPFSSVKEQELRDISAVVVTVNRKLTAASGPTLKRPFNHEVDRFFLGTFDRYTRVTDLRGQPLVGSGAGGWKDGVLWEESINQLILRPTTDVVGLTDSYIQVFDWNSATCKQKVAFPGSVKLQLLSDRPGGIIVIAARKRKSPVVYWLKEKMQPMRYKRLIAKPTKLMSPSMAQLHLNEAIGSGQPGPADYNALMAPGSPFGVPSQRRPSYLGAVDLGRLAPSGSQTSLSSRGSTPPSNTEEYIRMRNQYLAPQAGSPYRPTSPYGSPQPVVNMHPFSANGQSSAMYGNPQGLRPGYRPPMVETGYGQPYLQRASSPMGHPYGYVSDSEVARLGGYHSPPQQLGQQYAHMSQSSPQIYGYPQLGGPPSFRPNQPVYSSPQRPGSMPPQDPFRGQQGSPYYAPVGSVTPPPRQENPSPVPFQVMASPSRGPLPNPPRDQKPQQE